VKLLELSRHWVAAIPIIKLWVGEGGETVSHSQAQARANVCLECPLNQKMPLERELASLLKKISKLKNQLILHVTGEQRLHSCQACSCPLTSKVWVPLEYIRKGVTDEELKDFHHDCWIRKESNS
jgi:hypothetical protein